VRSNDRAPLDPNAILSYMREVTVTEITAEMPNVRVMLQGQSNCWGKGQLSDLDGPFAELSELAKNAFKRVFIMSDGPGVGGTRPCTLA